MKRYAFILLVLLSAGAVRAQRYEKNILGVRAGVNVSTCDISIEDVRINILSPGTPGNILSGGLILPLNVAVGLVVCCTMYSFYMYFRRGEL